MTPDEMIPGHYYLATIRKRPGEGWDVDDVPVRAYESSDWVESMGGLAHRSKLTNIRPVALIDYNDIDRDDAWPAIQEQWGAALPDGGVP